MSQTQLDQVIAFLRNMAHPQTLEEMRASYEGLSEILPTPTDAQVETVQINDVLADWVAAPKASEGRIILYLHGGGYVFGSRNTHRPLAYNLSAASNARVLLLEYRLAPENPFPAALDDAVSAYRWLIQERGFESRQVAIAGDSAGGGLTMAALVALRQSEEPLPAAAVCISPWVDLEGRGVSMESKAEVDPVVQPWMVQQFATWYLNGVNPHTPLAAPIYADLSNLSPLLIQVGSNEVLLDDAVLLANLFRAAGGSVELKIWPNMIHVWHLFAPMLAEGQDAINEAGQFLNQYFQDSQKAVMGGLA
ncbi:MAG: alpha/beta hydrolase [Leptolyngbyaceae cyanobacterium MO_188.B28]|nr:alpha/beta hydrolase [Leptolyngbyaceae cyanobacterium MO_188.B28]